MNSILLAFDSAFERYSGFRLIQDWNEYLRDMCTSRSYCYYVDNDSICNEYRWLYDSDDVHVLKDFYPIWAANIMITQYRNELEDQLNGVDSSNSGSTDGESGSQDGEGQDGESTDMSYRMEGGVRS